MRSFDPVAFTLFGVEVRWYGILIALGVLAAAVIGSLREKRLGLKKDTAVNIILIALPAAIVCARLYYVAFSWDLFRENPMSILNLRSGGLALYGGLIGGIAAGVIYTAASGQSIGRAADMAAPCIAVGQAFGRWGNYFNQEAYGARIENPALRFFPAGVFIDAEGDWFYAAFFYESCWCLMICAALLLLEWKRAFRRPGDGIFWYGFLYAMERVCVEALRSDSLYLGGARVSQLVSALALLGVTALFIVRAKRPRLLLLCAPACALCLIAGLGLSAPFAVLALLSLCQLPLTALCYRKTPAVFKSEEI